MSRAAAASAQLKTPSPYFMTEITQTNGKKMGESSLQQAWDSESALCSDDQ